MTQAQPLCLYLSRETVAEAVHRFYLRLRADQHLGAYFSHITDWPGHETHITDFWWGLMGGKVEKPRPNAMEQGHRDLDFGHAELEAWLALFTQAVHDTLPAETAGQWEALARRIGKQMVARGMLRHEGANTTDKPSGQNSDS